MNMTTKDITVCGEIADAFDISGRGTVVTVRVTKSSWDALPANIAFNILRVDGVDLSPLAVDPPRWTNCLTGEPLEVSSVTLSFSPETPPTSFPYKRRVKLMGKSA